MRSAAFLQVRAAAIVLVVLAGPAAGVSAAGEGSEERNGRRERTLAATLDAVAVPLTSPVVVDGNFDEAVWHDAPAIGAFVQREPLEGAPPTFATEVRVAYDVTNLYVAVALRWTRTPSRLVGFLTRRDGRSSSDWLRVIIDSSITIGAPATSSR